MKDKFARIAYEAYRNHTGGISLATGVKIPEWADLRPDIKAAWMASANAVIAEASRPEEKI